MNTFDGVTLAAVWRSGNPGREKDDFYVTPAKATRALMQVEAFGRQIWEPACGDGAISRVFEDAGHDVISTDLVDRGYGTPRIDFLMEQKAAAAHLVTNPPFKNCDDFVLHALALGVTKMAIFNRTCWLEGGERHRRLWSVHPPVRIWQFCRRQTLPRGSDPNALMTGGAIAFAWFVWERGYRGAPAIGWLP